MRAVKISGNNSEDGRQLRSQNSNNT